MPSFGEHGLHFRHGPEPVQAAREGAGHLHLAAAEGAGDLELGHVTLEAHALLADAAELDFRGNTEGRDLLSGGEEVIVTDGFTGNVALKLLEGTIRSVLEALRQEITATTRGKLGGLLIRPAARRLRTRLDPDTYGGAYLLGLRGLAVTAHGNSSARAIANAVRLAARGVEHDVVGRLEQRLRTTVLLESGRSTAPTPE